MQNLCEVNACLGEEEVGVGQARQMTWIVGRTWVGLMVGSGLHALRLGTITMPTPG